MSVHKINKSISARDILALLAARHSEDVFVPECKNGPTQSVRNYLRLDAWVMAKSWTNPHVIGYEIKVSRGDFLGDDKWRGYLPYCNSFYFVAPVGLIDPAELPPEAGLLVASKNCRTVQMKKKAARREVKIPEEIFRYVLMARARIAVTESWDKRQQAREIAASRVEDRKLGYLVSKAIREKVEHVEMENDRLTRKMQGYDDLINILQRLGYSESEIARGWIGERSFQERLAVIQSAVPPQLQADLANIARLCGKAAEDLAKHLTPTGAPAPVVETEGGR